MKKLNLHTQKKANPCVRIQMHGIQTSVSFASDGHSVSSLTPQSSGLPLQMRLKQEVPPGKSYAGAALEAQVYLPIPGTGQHLSTVKSQGWNVALASWSAPGPGNSLPA